MTVFFCRLALWALICLPLNVYAFTDDEVVKWSSAVLTQTLSASYQDTPEQIAAVRSHYMLAAWGPMLDFFVEKRAYVQKNQLTLHPTPLSDPTLVASGLCHDLPCWRVNQSFSVPELAFNIDFSLLITITGNMSDPALIVQSMDFVLHDIPKS